MIRWGVLTRQRPMLVNPCTSVVKDGDVAEQCQVVAALGRPCPGSRPQDVEAINQHIMELKGEGLTGVEDVGVLKLLKIRFCINWSELLNPLTIEWPFSYAGVSDLIAPLGQTAWMATWDLERLLQPAPAAPGRPSAVRGPTSSGGLPDELAAELARKGEDSMLFSSGYAQYGDQPFPCLASGASATASSILREHEVPNVFLIDDFATVGSSEEECRRRLDLAIRIFDLLGLKLNPAKIVSPVRPWSSWACSSTPSAGWCLWSQRR